jgi:hypothetical protein
LLLVKGGVRWTIYSSFGSVTAICEEPRGAEVFFPPEFERKRMMANVTGRKIKGRH